MQTLSRIALLGACVLGGCQAVSNRLEQRFSNVPAKVQDFAFDEQTVRAAVLVAFQRLDFDVSGSADNGAGIEATGRIRRSEALGDARQLVADVQLEETAPGQTEVRLLLKEQVEDETSGSRSEQTLREHGFYGTFFDTLQQILGGSGNPSESRPGG